MTKLTDLQFATLEHYAFHEMTPANTALPESLEETGSYLWSFELQELLGLGGRAVGGIFHGLQAAELAVIISPDIQMSRDPGKQRNDGRDPDGWFRWTQKGFDAWQEARVERGLPISR